MLGDRGARREEDAHLRRDVQTAPPSRTAELPPGARAAFAGTILFGGAHALASLSWGLGSTALLGTIGAGAVELREEAPWWVFAMLIAVGVAKLAGVAVPIANARGRLPRPRLWRTLSWIGAVGLIAYGSGYAVIAHLALSGMFGTPDDRPGLVGHAYLWDPLFALWGLCLATALWLTRPTREQRG